MPRLLPFLALFISSLPFLTVGFPGGDDWLVELVRIAEFKTAILSKQIPPYWGENLYGGYGSPIFLFYPPLYLSISTLCSVLTGSLTGGGTLALIIFSLVAVVSMKLLLQAALGERSYENEAASRVSTYFFILNPYLICDKLLRNANAEYAALCVFPLAVYGLLILNRKPQAGGLILAIGLALIITAHNLTALVAITFIIAAALVLYPPSKTITLWGTVIGSIALSLGLSAFFWIPAIYYKSLVRIDQMVRGKFDFHIHYQSITSLFDYDHFFATGLLTPIVLLCAIGIFWNARNQKKLLSMKLNIFAFGASMFFLFLQTRASVYLWETIPLMPLFQFPWRMMGPLALVTSIIAGLSFAYLCKGRSKKIIIFGEIAILILCIANAVPHLRGAKPLLEFVPGQYSQLLTGDVIKEYAMQATVLDEYLPRSAYPGVRSAKRSQTGAMIDSVPSIEIKTLKNSGANIVLETNADTPARLRVGRWFFPGWICTINGTPHTVGRNEFGSIDILIPAGFNRITLQLRPPLLRRGGLWVSIASLIISCVFIIKYCRTER